MIQSPRLVEPERPQIPEELRRSCRISLPAPAANGDLVDQRNALAKAVEDCDNVRAELVELLGGP